MPYAAFPLHCHHPMEPENKVCSISLILMLCIQHPLVIGPVLDTVQMEQTIEHLCTAAVLFCDLCRCHQRIGRL